jgi:hypothetical protein
MYERHFGEPEGIEKRLVAWRRQLALDRSYPWIGTGILDDLVCAAKLLGADVSEFEQPDPRQETMSIIPAEPEQQPMEFDL